MPVLPVRCYDLPLYHHKTQSSFVADCVLIHCVTARISAKDGLVGLRDYPSLGVICINLRDRRRAGMGRLDLLGLGYETGFKPTSDKHRVVFMAVQRNQKRGLKRKRAQKKSQADV